MDIRWKQALFASVGFALSGYAMGLLVWRRPRRLRANEEPDVVEFYKIIDTLCPGLRVSCQNARETSEKTLISWSYKRIQIDELKDEIKKIDRRERESEDFVAAQKKIGLRLYKAISDVKALARIVEFCESSNPADEIGKAKSYLAERKNLKSIRFNERPGSKKYERLTQQIRELDDNAARMGLVQIDPAPSGSGGRNVRIEKTIEFIRSAEKDYESRTMQAREDLINAWEHYYHRLTVAEASMTRLGVVNNERIDLLKYRRQLESEILDLEEQKAQCDDEYSQQVKAADILCEKYRACESKYLDYSKWAKLRKERQQRRATDPLSMPMRPQDARFGVELEVLFPDENERDPILQAAFAVRRVVGCKDDCCVFQRERGEEDKSIRWRDRAGREWRVQRDLSLGEQGAEVVSPILSLKEIGDVMLIGESLTAYEAVSAGKIGKTHAGLHVHVSHPTQSERMVPIAQSAVELDTKTERDPHRAQEWAKPLPASFRASLKPGMTEDQVLDAWYESVGQARPRSIHKQHPSRYHGINLHALPYMGTVEVRAFDGTLDPQKLKKAILDSVKVITARFYKNRRKPARRWR